LLLAATLVAAALRFYLPSGLPTPIAFICAALAAIGAG